jgi:hypothetical protein
VDLLYNAQHLTLQLYNTLLSVGGDNQGHKEARRELAEFVVNTCLCLCDDSGGATKDEEVRLHFVAPAAVQDQMNGAVNGQVKDGGGGSGEEVVETESK